MRIQNRGFAVVKIAAATGKLDGGLGFSRLAL